MGNRATIQIVDEAGESSPANIYLHWHGEPDYVCQFVKDAAKVMRKSNADYATARLVAHVCRAIDNNTDALSVGLQQPGDNEQAAALLDHGHYVVDMGDGTITQYNRWLPNGGEVIREINIEFYGG